MRTKVSKSAKIRQFLAENPGASTQEVVETMAKQGTKVEAGLVYNVKANTKGKTKAVPKAVAAPRRAPAVAAKTRRNGNGRAFANGFHRNNGVVNTVKEVKSLAQKVGGMDELKELVDAMAG